MTAAVAMVSPRQIVAVAVVIRGLIEAVVLGGLASALARGGRRGAIGGADQGDRDDLRGSAAMAVINGHVVVLRQRLTRRQIVHSAVTDAERPAERIAAVDISRGQ